MTTYKIIKDNDILGPFDIYEIREFVQSGLILKRDYAYNIAFPNVIKNVGFFLRQCNADVKIEHKGNLFSQIREIGGELIIPSTIFTKEPWKKDRKLLMLAIFGLTLYVILSIAPFFNIYMVFYCISLYFSAIWGLFFYYLFKTEQVSLNKTVAVFFASQIFSFLTFYVLDFYKYDFFENMFDSDNSFVALLSCILGIGIPEEFVKFLPIIIVLYNAKIVLSPKTVVYYGLISGIAFGVFEGIGYQLGPNFEVMLEAPMEQAYVYSFITNIARLTSIPFLHAIWCGIASYFGSFAYLYPRYRISLFTLAILIPAFLHGLYDFLCFNDYSLLSLPVVLVCVVLLMVYLNKRYDFHSRLSD